MNMLSFLSLLCILLIFSFLRIELPDLPCIIVPSRCKIGAEPPLPLDYGCPRDGGILIIIIIVIAKDLLKSFLELSTLITNVISTSTLPTYRPPAVKQQRPEFPLSLPDYIRRYCSVRIKDL